MTKEVKKPGFCKSLFDKETAIIEAKAYNNLRFFKKSKNILIIFILIISIVSVAISMYGNIDGINFQEIIIGVIVYIILLPFIYFNHRWAIILVCLIYSLDKILFIATGVGAPISHIMFLFICLSLSYKSFIVANYLKTKK